MIVPLPNDLVIFEKLIPTGQAFFRHTQSGFWLGEIDKTSLFFSLTVKLLK